MFPGTGLDLQVRTCVQVDRQGGKKLDFDSASQLFGPEFIEPHASGVAKCLVLRFLLRNARTIPGAVLRRGAEEARAELGPTHKSLEDPPLLLGYRAIV